MTQQRDQAIKEQAEKAQWNRDQAAACLIASELIYDIIRIDVHSDMVISILRETAKEIGDRYNNHTKVGGLHAERANVLRAHSEAAAKGAPFRPVERLGVLTAVRPQKYETE